MLDGAAGIHRERKGDGMTEKSRYIQIATASIGVFADDGKLDMREFEYLLSLALEDGVIDDDEKRVLGSIFRKVTPADVGPGVWNRIQEVRQKHGID